MRTTLRNTVLALSLLAGVPSAQAAVQVWNLSGTLDSGYYETQTFAGTFSFDDATLTGFADELLAVSNLSINIFGTSYTQANAMIDSTPDVSFDNGAFLGLSYSAGTAGEGFTFVPGTTLGEAFVAYDTPFGLSGSGSVSYVQAIPEPETYALMLAGLGLLAWRRTRRQTS